MVNVHLQARHKLKIGDKEMKKYKIEIKDDRTVNAVNDKISGTSPNSDMVCYGTNYTNDDQLYNCVLEYKKGFQVDSIQVYKLDQFTIEDYRAHKKRFVSITDDYIQVDGHRMKFKEKRGYTYMCRKTFIGTEDVTRFAALLANPFWICDAIDITRHVLDNGKLVANF